MPVNAGGILLIFCFSVTLNLTNFMPKCIYSVFPPKAFNILQHLDYHGTQRSPLKPRLIKDPDYQLFNAQ